MKAYRLCSGHLASGAFGIVIGFVTTLLCLKANLIRHSVPSIKENEVLNHINHQPLSGSDIRKAEMILKERHNINDKISELAKTIYKAKKHVRGIKTADSLICAVRILDDILEDLNINSTMLKQRQVVAAKSVCPEEFKGTKYGYPFFYEGFEVKACDYGKPITDLLTIAVYIEKTNSYENIERTIERLIRSVFKVNASYQIVLAADMGFNAADMLTKEFPNLLFWNTSDIRRWSAGKVWNSLVESARTPYVFIARNVEILTNDTRFERLILEIESLNLAAAGGAFRTRDGHWKNGCHQVAYKNYSMSFYHGYDESIHECIFCDYIEGPFIAPKKILTELGFSDYLDETDGLFEDWYLRLKASNLEVVVCPDSMFHTFDKVIEREKWNSFMTNWDLYHLYTPLGQSIFSSCYTAVSFPKSKALSPCWLKRLADVLKFVMRSCEKANLTCELQEGTVLGAVKLNAILPWERDADVTFLSGNGSVFQILKEAFETYEDLLGGLDYLWLNNKAAGKFIFAVPGWYVEMFGQQIMDSELLKFDGMNATKVLLDGEWVNVPRNPGLFVRNRYGHEMYRHAVHWLTLGKRSGWINYKTDQFLSCEDPGHHACLDRYSTDGNLQFERPLP